MRLRPAILTLALALAGGAAHADEGMWMPSQLPQLAKELKAAGFKGNPADLADLTKPPMSAVVSLGGCTASFVSPQGLVVTNHHCAYGAIQLNSTPQDNLIEKGFIAASANIAELDPEIRPEEIAQTRVDDVDFDTILSNSFGFGGTNATLVMSKYRE